MKSSPLVAVPILFSAFQHSEICEMLNGVMNTEGGNPVNLRKALGLRRVEDVAELASFLLFHTAGVGRVVEVAIFVLMETELLKTRGPNQTINDVLGGVKAGRELLRAVKEGTPQGIEPNWSMKTEGWDKDLARTALVEVLQLTRDNKAMCIDTLFTVAHDVRVTAVDLLSVVGVPFVLDGHLMNVHLGVWMVQSLLYNGDVHWTAEETAQQLKGGVKELLKVAGKVGVVSTVEAAGSVLGTAAGAALVSVAQQAAATAV
jgi:hypothetical protein